MFARAAFWVSAFSHFDVVCAKQGEIFSHSVGMDSVKFYIDCKSLFLCFRNFSSYKVFSQCMVFHAYQSWAGYLKALKFLRMICLRSLKLGGGGLLKITGLTLRLGF